MDNKFKTNKYRLHLFEIVVVTSIKLTFLAVFVLFSSECEKNFFWALKRFRGLFVRADVFPQVIVSYRDLSLTNAINFIFPETCNLLCRFHMNKNVKAKCKILIDSREAWDIIMDAWIVMYLRGVLNILNVLVRHGCYFLNM